MTDTKTLDYLRKVIGELSTLELVLVLVMISDTLMLRACDGDAAARKAVQR